MESRSSRAETQAPQGYRNGASALGAAGNSETNVVQFLSRIGCNNAQGFLLSKPLRQEDFEALLIRDEIY